MKVELGISDSAKSHLGEDINGRVTIWPCRSYSVHPYLLYELQSPKVVTTACMNLSRQDLDSGFRFNPKQEIPSVEENRNLTISALL